MPTPLYTALVTHRDLNRAPFHTPGHKNNPLALPQDLLALDFTELPDTDSLFEADGPILEAERLAAKLFHAERTCISAGGCTLCIQAMFRLAAPNGGKIVCSRVLHRSAVNAMALLGIEPVWALPQDIVSAVENNPDAEAVYVTSPNYYGELLDIPAIASACKKADIPLLVDNAHGTHLMFTDPVLHPLALGASMTACSAHKTLNVLTGGAWLNIADSRFADGAKDAMALFGSTSPSYPVMASLDLARAWLETHKNEYAALQARVEAIKTIAQEHGLSVPQGQTDPTRITLNTASIGLSGTAAAEIFRGAGVEPEYADGAHVVLIATPFNTESDFTRLEDALDLLPVRSPLPGSPELPSLPPVRASLREAVFAAAETVPLESALGRTAAQAACPCPPGVPVVMPGEEITKDILRFLKGYGFFSIKVLK
ncbi:aminotransferase class I/II-fold pyridoxal phosphate-dependent enzyme [Caproiciproducens faecalis]|uniref:PLP-dependent transferase n=1 Tax=Caproiciproducens faecalis TaxID=2820301 RepID=A0ABS7DNC9_9FIRM|nr:aminotransferase class I/II-fold pyridoxal phosphate-dependent enzyme [Caproiciproducens faecalis]MBW7572803.1 PLP-dependent transferase [Caproiciproducens faecalis]